MSEPKPIDPCLSLEIQEDGAVLLTIAAQLRPGALNWTPAEAGIWFARSWQRAEHVLAAVTIHRALEQGQVHLVAQGSSAWGAVAVPTTEMLEAIRTSTPQAADVPLPTPVIPHRDQDEAQIAITLDEEDEATPPPSMLNGPETLLGVPAPRQREKGGDSKTEKQLLRVLNRSTQPMSIADLCKQTGLTIYRVRKALEDLIDNRLIQEEKMPSRGRYKEMSVYSGTMRGAGE